MFLKFVTGFCISLCFYLFIYYKQQDNYIEVGSTTSSNLRPPNVEVPQPPSRSILHVYDKAAVCSDKTTCSSIGSSILKHKGNAIDAAIATLLCNGLITMQSMGLGGGVILAYYKHEKRKTKIIIGRERAPLNIRLKNEEIQNASSFAKSVLSIAVPGELAAYHEAYKRYGSLPWTYLVKPTLELCYRGYQLTRHQRDALKLNEEMIRQNVLLTHMFIDPITSYFYKEGWRIKFPSVVCDTYRLIAAEGPLTFYNGTLASLIVKDLKEMGSPITLADLYAYKAEVKDSLVMDLEPYNVHLPLPPGSGHVVAFIIKLLNNFKRDFATAKQLNTLEVHRIIECLKFGFVKRWQYDADVDLKTIENLLQTKPIENISFLINDLKTFDNPKYYGSKVNFTMMPTDYGTAQISLIAPNGDAVSATSSINYYFGSGRMGYRSGILFNNAMSDFTIENFKNYFNLPDIKNVNNMQAQKYPMSSMVPLIVTNKATGAVRLVVGAAGGTRIISTLTQILVSVLWQKQNIKQAIDAARFHHQLIPNILEYEFGLLQQIVQDLEERGHKTERVRRKSTAVCGVEKNETGVVRANADYRKEGGVDGF